MSVSKDFDSYNPRRYTAPWGAVVTFNDSASPEYNFNAGSYLGDDSGGTVHIKCAVGDIVAFGRKDKRGGNTTNDWFIVEEGFTLWPAPRNVAYEHWQNRHG